jgi:hypothetical protein
MTEPLVDCVDPNQVATSTAQASPKLACSLGLRVWTLQGAAAPSICSWAGG